MLSIFLSLFLGSVLITAGDTPSQQNSPEKTSEALTAATEPSGVATVVEIKGQAKAVSKSTGEERALKEGDALYLDEMISTSVASSMQLEMADESLFTLSENTSIRMDLFDLDEQNKDGHLTANVAKGVFRFVSGKVAKLKPENVNIEVPSGTIGIRGTIVLGEIEGEKCLVSLEAEEGDRAQHRIVFSGLVDGQKQEVEITKPGFATMIEARGMAPKPIFELPQENIERFKQNLPSPKYLPRDAEGRPAMNPNVRDPQKYPGPMIKRDDQKNTGGPNPPNGPGGGDQGKENLSGEKPGGNDVVGRDKKEPQAFDKDSQGEKQGFREPEKSAYEKAGYQLPFEEKADDQSGDQLSASLKIENDSQNSGPKNKADRPGEFGNFKPDFGNRGPQKQAPGSFQSSQSGSFQQGQFGRPQGSTPQQGQGGPQGSGQKPSDQGNNRPGGGGPAQGNGSRQSGGGGPKR